VRPADVAEIEQGPDAAAVALENAVRKASASWRQGAGEAVIGCDTIVVLDGVIYGKPADAGEARATLAALAGSTHEVISGLAVLVGDERRTGVARTRVTFRRLDDPGLDGYVATGEWRGRSGGYAIQGAGAQLALSIDGDEDNVVGLPLRMLVDLYPEIAQR
jgi:septum formation protein